MSARRTTRDSASWLREIVAPFRRNAATAILLGIVSFAFATLLMFASGYLISKTAQPTTTLFMVMVPVALVQVFGIGRPLSRYFERLVSHDWVFRVTSSLRLSLFEAMERRSGDPAKAKATGEYLELLADDIGHLQNLYLRVAFPTVVALSLFAVVTVLSGLLSLELALCVFAFCAIAAILVPAGTALAAWPLQHRAKALRSGEYARIADDVMGAADWVVAGRGDDAVRKHAQAGMRASAAQARIRTAVRLAELASALVFGAAIMVVTALAAGAFAGDAERVNYIAAFALAAFPLIEVFALLPASVADYAVHDDAVARLGAIASDSAPTSDAQPRERAAQCAISVEGASYSYPGSKANVLDSLRLSVPYGQKIAVLGRSGAGKSTLAALIRGTIAPSSGKVLVGGVPATDLSANDACPVAYVPQSPYVFSQTLRDNLAIADETATDAQMTDALARVGLAGRLATLDGGLDCKMGEAGTGLSGGEAHRLGLARALLSKRPIVLLDEPFTAVDPATELMLIDTAFDALADKTLVVITHHLAGIERFDRVVFIEDGRIAKDGSPRDLARDDPQFRKLLDFDRDFTSRRPLAR